MSRFNQFKKSFSEKKKEKEEKKEEEDKVENTLAFSIFDEFSSSSSMRTVGLYGDIDEERAAEVIYSMVSLKHSGKKEEEIEGSEEKKVTYEPFDMVISTSGGIASEMFAIYDVMRLIKQDCDIEVLALGKVMSAGVLVLAAGTKGKRKIGRNCRVMLHGVKAGQAGYVHEMETELAEVKWNQQRYLECLEECTELTMKQLKRFVAKKSNVYLTAEEAVQYGIADEIV